MERVSVGCVGWCGLHQKDFARRFDVVEFNWTFHEREDGPEQFRRTASDLKELRLQAFLKVSGVATHEQRLRSPELWWPKLWAKYSELHKEGVLAGLLWQLAPSFHCTTENLGLLSALARHLPKDALHAFEFRHSSWFGRESVLELMRNHGLCLAWAHIANEDGWCGDLESGWVTKAATCGSLYLRLFGTKKKAIGRYSQAFLENEILPILRSEPGKPVDAYVVFAQADVPEHALADAGALVETLGRPPVWAGRGSRWEREVLAATLGLDVGVDVEGVVTRITHRTIFLDIGRSCRAFLDANHARRQGLLEELRVGTTLEHLVVENIDFQGEWGLIGLSCLNAAIGVTALTVPAPMGPGRPQEVAAKPDAKLALAQKERRWRRTPDEQAAVLRQTGRHPKLLEGGGPREPQAEKAADEEQEEQEPQAPELAEEAAAAAAPLSRSPSPERERPPPELEVEASAKPSRWGRARRMAAAPERAPEAASSAAAGASRQVPVQVQEPDEGAFSFSKDELLVIQMERRLDREGGADLLNDETFGSDHDGGWSVQDMFSANEQLRRREVGWNRQEAPVKKGRNKITHANAEAPPIVFQ